MSARDREHVQAVHGPGCMCIHYQHERAVAAAKAQVVAPKLEVALPKREVTAAAPRARKATTVSNAQPDVKPVSNGAARIARWRAKQDPEVRKQRNREAVQRSRAKRKAGKPVGS